MEPQRSALVSCRCSSGLFAFLLGGRANTSMLVFGVTQFENLNPINPVIINRGETVNLSAKLVEATDLFAPLGGYPVAIMFHESWVADTTTTGDGFANASFVLDANHPLGLVTVPGCSMVPLIKSGYC